MDAYLRADAERLGEQIWSDDELHAYLADIDAKRAAGATVIEFNYSVRAGRFEWMDKEYRLHFQEKTIRLTQMQADMINQWIQASKQRFERDSHFAGFAELLWDEIEDKIIVVDNSMARHYHPLAPEVRKEIERLIARRAYDLVEHARKHITNEVHEGNFLTWMFPHDIPDMTEWSEPRS